MRVLNDSLQPAVRQEVVAEDLGEYFTAALPANPRIDAVGFTGETVVNQLKLCLERRERRGQPHVTLRIIVPDFTKPMAVPGKVVDGKAEDDPELRRDFQGKVVQHVHTMAALDRRLRYDRRGEVDAEFRVLHISPFLKFCLIGREQLFDGIYDQVKEGPAQTAPERPVLDLMGYDAILTRWDFDAGAAAREKIRNRGLLFDTLWRVARPLTPPSS